MQVKVQVCQYLGHITLLHFLDATVSRTNSATYVGSLLSFRTHSGSVKQYNLTLQRRLVLLLFLMARTFVHFSYV